MIFQKSKAILVAACLMVSCAAFAQKAAPVKDPYALGQKAYSQQDFKSAAKLFKEAAQKGIPAAQHELAAMHINGQGVPMNYAEAMRLYLLAADAGYAASQNGLGVMFSKEFGVPSDPILAYALYNLASANGLGITAEVNRDVAARKLTPGELLIGQNLSQEMFSSGKVSGVVKRFSKTKK